MKRCSKCGDTKSLASFKNRTQWISNLIAYANSTEGATV